MAAAALKEQLQTDLQNFLREEHRFIPKMLAKAEKSSGVQRENIVYGAAIAIALYLVIGHGAELLCNTICFGYPAYASFEAIETESKEDDTQWLTYWTVFGTVSLLDFAADKIMGVIPIYWLAKCVFFLWLYIPYFRGAEQLHRKYFGPAYQRVRPILQGVQADTQQAAMSLAVQQQQQVFGEPAADQAPAMPEQGAPVE